MGIIFDLVSSAVIDPGKAFLLTFWSAASGVQVWLDNTQLTGNVQTYLTAGQWTLYSIKITGGQGSNIVTLKSSGADIPVDEVRLYPIDASMRTYCYLPLVGIQSLCDERNNIVHNQWSIDGTYNPTTTAFDMQGNVLSHTINAIQKGND